ncbi:hypothetical protein Sfulv_10250 [Streptomyces fulvorobeus]|uniref:AMP-dependent synthetase/ligase domain-containing protein n=1 Tax=Streptomyces fulvorobeus TaxID=284028 RepID=A0A7J0C2M9_9ACTN|nr:hypothetical protein Sfulv_10250 [Streptomyces fulvorobeus]
MSESVYAAKPWLALLSEAQRAPVSPARTLVHAFRAAASRAPGHPALVYFDGRLDYRETDALSDSVAGHLAARGLRRGDRVAIMLQNTPQFVIALLGAWKAGATVVPLNPMYKSGEVGHVLKDAGVSALVCSDRAWGSGLRATAEAAPDVRIAVTACELDLQTRNDPRVLGFERLPAPGGDDWADDLVTVARQGLATPAGRELGAADVALISYTSGTSGTPKGAMNSHGNIMVNAERQRRGTPSRRAPPTSRSPRSSTSPAWCASSPPASPTRAPWSSPTASRRASSWKRSPSTAPPTPSARRPRSWRSPPTPA